MLRIPITLLWLALEGYQLVLIDFPALKRWKQVTILGLLVAVAFYGGVAEFKQVGDADRQGQQIDQQSKKIDHLQTELDNSYQLLSGLAESLAALTGPGIKKEALNLGMTLLSRTHSIMLKEGDHLPRENPPPENPALLEHQQQEVEESHREAATEMAELVADYKNNYAPEIEKLRAQFVMQGQTNWESSEYYANANSEGDFLKIGEQLVKHANALK
jgi:hypothetical protein